MKVDRITPSQLVDGRQVLVVSNRQPYRHEYIQQGNQVTVEQPSGGLTEALDPVVQTLGGMWIAWGDGSGDPDVVDTDSIVRVPEDDQSYRLRRVWLKQEEVRGYYDRFSNQVIWPICHGALTQVRCPTESWKFYRDVNEQFATTVVEEADNRSLIWFHDYHLALAPEFVRSRLSDDEILLHFWHIPWPAWDSYRACPYGRDLLEGLLANDHLAFHVPRYRDNFLQCVASAFENARIDWDTHQIKRGGRTVRVEAIPMGVPVDQIRQLASESKTNVLDEFDIPRETRLIISVDRLDYTKGIVERLAAFEELFSRDPALRGNITLVQISSKSRSRIPAYREIQARISDDIDRLNDRFGTSEWKPIIEITDRLSQASLYELFDKAEIAIVSPIRDGMNLVAQEYVAAQTDNPGVLVLSNQVGVHDIVGETAVSVNPFDIDRFADAIGRALTMPEKEREWRIRRLQRFIVNHDLDSWLRKNLRLAIGDTVDPSSLPQS